MKKVIINYIFLLTTGAFCISIGGCKKMLDQKSQTTITDPVFWKTTNDLITGTNYLYTFLPDINTPYDDTYSDIAMSILGSLNNISNGSRVAPATSGLWESQYKLIRAANNIIEKSTGITGDDAVIKNCIGQARFFRALAYFNLVRAFGDVPYVAKTLLPGDPELYGPRVARQTIITSMYEDLDFAAANCPQPDQIASSTSQAGQMGKEYGRITRSAALAFKSRVALFEGSWEKFHTEMQGAKDPNKHFQAAIDACKTIITEAKHSLFAKDGANSFQTLFRYQGETYAKNKENILARLYGQNLTNNVSGHSYMRTGLTDGANASTRAFVTMALYSDGLPAGKSPLDSNGKEANLLTDYSNRDPRMVLTLFKKGDPYVSINSKNVTYGNTYYYQQQKYWSGPDDFFNSGNVFLDFIIIRYGEVLLNYAEALYELNESITDDDLNATINLLRKRATNNNTALLPLLTNEFVTTNGLDMREEIRRERTIELAFEGFRYWDLLRWKTAENELPKPLLQRKYFPAENYGTGTAAPKVLLDGYIVLEPASARKFDASKDYLWPIPTTQIGLYPPGVLTQNPGWQ
ncbi:RagB/SusD family nutrient uptake outer membrane protein [Terrimonas pollutisoli]|uniref:RagB/SusD family nutrient uptake outer membrane protein n=1 Tax=Terrimonas pollutisoli TaxID=3034147 RepID=UPI0023EC6B8A|nr:RagB/SusD family nutrient uptake outer membrane protein [Terrimonas sp. H1YJ31]